MLKDSRVRGRRGEEKSVEGCKVGIGMEGRL